MPVHTGFNIIAACLLFVKEKSSKNPVFVERRKIFAFSVAFFVELWYTLDGTKNSASKETLKGRSLMKCFKRFALLILAMAMLLGGCAQPAQTPPPSTTQAPVPSTQAKPQPTQTQPQPTTPPETTPVMPYQNPLNGEPMAQPYTGRPVAIMLNNIISAMPMFGNSEADIVYEMIAEGGITRCLGIYSDVAGIPKIGSVRSSRKYYVEISQLYDAIYVHIGGATEALNYLKQIDIDEMEGMRYSSYMFQDMDRVHSGYSREHTWFVSGDSILKFAKDKNFSLSSDPNKDYGMTFDDESVLVGTASDKVTAYFNQGGAPGKSTKYTAFHYNAEEKLYYAEQYNKDFIDAATQKTMSFRNVLVLRTKNSLQDNHYRMTIATTGSGEGFFACNGQVVPIKWSRDSVTSPFKFTLANGDPITFGVGKTYIAMIPLNGKVDF